MIDFHTHTTCSDGQYTPEELVQKAAAIGIRALAVTDHDTVSGVKRAVQAAKSFSIQVFTGMEISTRENPQLHLLGYGIDGENPQLLAYIERNKQLRTARKERMIAFLHEKGVPLTLEDVANANDGRMSGRPHFAKAMLEKGYVSSIDEAFDCYLATKEYNERVERPKPTAEEAIAMIHAAGGIAVMAHPAKLLLEEAVFLALLKRLTAVGLQGIEAYYSTHTPKQMAWYASIAKQYDLFCTCGSDFHGEIVKPGIALGTGLHDSLRLPAETEAELLKTFCQRLAARANQ